MSTGLTNFWKLLSAGKKCRLMPEFASAGTARKLSLYGDVRIVCWELHCAGHVCKCIIEKILSIKLNTGTEVIFARLLYLRLAHIY